MAPKTVSGSCLCGSVRFEIELPTGACAHCHCTQCRRAHGAGYVTWVILPIAQFRLRSGEDRLARFKSSDHGTRSFCGTCGSSLLFESTQDPERIDVVLSNLQEPIDREPELHVFFDDRARWIRVEDRLPRLGGKTGYEPLH
jgi:hypothetical protein